ncbi:hypothetical protein [Halorarius halobius]|uniref:hypothetical protein n=1 Tax=Halorarius halobius TaxID=2962671 RepID=UPI0020CE5535|nr:hypothetical protein [Halorarius halobius]
MNTLQPETLELFIHWLIPVGAALSAGIDTAYVIGPYIRAITGPLVPLGGYRAISTLTRVLAELVGDSHSPLLYPFVDATANAFLHTNTHTQQASVIPLQSGADLSTLISDLKAAVTLPGWVGSAIKWTGLITLVIGIIAYFISPSINNRRRGFVMATTGFVLTIIGFAFPIFISLIHYVLSG